MAGQKRLGSAGDLTDKGALRLTDGTGSIDYVVLRMATLWDQC